MPGGVGDRAHRVERRERRAIGPLARHGVERVRDGEDAGAERDGVAGEPVGIAAAVETLVVAAHDPRGWAEEAEAREDRLAERRMLVHQAEFVGAERTRLLA